MKPLQAILATLFLLLCGKPLCAAPADGQPAPPTPRLTAEHIDKATAGLRDPTVITEKLTQGLKGLAVPDVQKAPTASVADSGLKDPTRMNQNFRDALNQIIKGKPAEVGGTNTPQTPALPEITLVASVCGMAKDRVSAMLRINGKTEMVHIGDKISAISNGGLIEVEVLDIHRHHVSVQVRPANEILILR